MLYKVHSMSYPDENVCLYCLVPDRSDPLSDSVQTQQFFDAPESDWECTLYMIYTA